MAALVPPQEVTARRWLGDDLRDPVEALRYRCRFCHTQPGQPCVTRDGTILPHPHYSRDAGSREAAHPAPEVRDLAPDTLPLHMALARPPERRRSA